MVVNPEDWRAKEVLNEYSNKFKKLDRVFAPEVVGNGTDGIVKPFEMDKDNYFKGGW